MNEPNAVTEACAARAPARCDKAGGTVIRVLGPTDYERCWRAMQAFTAVRTPATPDEIWLTEHPPVYTLGLAGRHRHLLRVAGARDPRRTPRRRQGRHRAVP